MSAMPAGHQGGVRFVMTSNVTKVEAAFIDQVHQALNRIAVHWHGESRAAAPVDLGRLRSSIAFSTPTVQAPVTITAAAVGASGRPRPDDVPATEVFTPPTPPPFTAIVGSNVNYAAAVHEGLTLEDKPTMVKEHYRTIRQAFGRRIAPRRVLVKAHTSRTGTRITKARKFIEGPARLNRWRYIQMLEMALRGRDSGPVVPPAGGGTS